jgi:hypothetical protein
MRNKYKATCYRCGKIIHEGDGHFEKTNKHNIKNHPRIPRGIKWLAQHSSCAIQYRGTDKSIYASIENPFEKKEECHG